MMIVQQERPTQVNDRISDKRLRILFLAPFAPGLQSSHGGGRAIGQLIAHMSQKHSIALCYLRASGEPAVENALADYCDVIEEVPIPNVETAVHNGWFRRLRVCAQLLAGKPLWAMDRFSPEFEKRVKILLHSWEPDIIQIEFHIMGQYLSALKDWSAPKILVQHEPGMDAARDAITSNFASGRIMPWLDLQAWKKFERKVMEQVQSVVVFTERDRDSIRKQGIDIPVVRIPLGAEIPGRPSTSAEEPASLLFIGSFKHLPNLDAVDRLLNRIFPQVQAENPESRLYIVGDHLPSRYLNQKNENVICTGYVPDVSPYLEKASVVVVPLRLGGGMRVKVLEALSAGKAIVASSRAVEGLAVADGEHIILAEDDVEFGHAIVGLLKDPHKRDNLAKNARAWASENLSWEKTTQAYEALYRRLLADHFPSLESVGAKRHENKK